ncbi:transmembrane protein 131-like [Denticeps clupeoides]|uniref:Transmembrane protein 131-like n=1 Tax=Denticeps clupeoides TaxID=299321 RepID=A0AAY4AER2_9TELE|nr:transmembrane protein 131-like [Denticeps clupeoides]
MAGRTDLRRGGHCHRKAWSNALLGVLQLLLSCPRHGAAQLRAGSVVEVWQAEDTELLVPSQVQEEHSKETLPQEESSSFYVRENGRPLRLQPPALDFGTQPLGLSRAETVYIHNPSQELPVTLLSIFTSSRHFHMPPFHRRVILPRGKTSFKLVFVPTEEGNVENTLFINTSTHGVLSYQIFGVGIPWGSQKDDHIKDQVLIFPHIKSIKLTQTQEDSSNITILGLLLECSLPKKVHSRPQGLCFVTEEEERFSLQISLSERGDQPAHLDKLKPYVIENIMVLFLVPSSSSDADPTISVHMLNAGAKKLLVKDIQLPSKADHALDFRRVLLKSSAANFTQIASLSCKRSALMQSKMCSSQVREQIKGNASVRTFPWLSHRPGVHLASLFQLRQRHIGGSITDLWFNNALLLRLTVTNVSISREAQGLVKVQNLSRTLTLFPGCWKLLSLELLNTTLPMNIVTMVTLTTSMGFTLEVPVHFRSAVSEQGDGEECGRVCSIRLPRAVRREWQRSLLPESSPVLWTVDSNLASALSPRWQKHKDQLSCRWPRLPLQTSSPLDFGAVPVNESRVKSLTLKNPTGSVVAVEIMGLVSYPAPLEALDLLSTWFDSSPLSVNVTTTEFTLLDTDQKVSERLIGNSGGRSLRFLLQSWESKTIAVVYTPTEHKPVTTLLLIRNNLTAFDMVTVKGLGAKELLRVGGKLPGPGASLRFNVPQSTLMECRDGMRTNKPLFAVRKSFKVENAGELPLTVMSMNINGYKCQGFGFEVLQCHSFTLDCNSSSEITIAFTPDFTSSWVIRDLTLLTARGSTFPFTLNVTLPHHMLPLCAQVVPGPSWEESFWVVTLVFTCFSLAGVCLMAFHQAQYILSEFSSLSSHSNHNSLHENGIINNGISNTVNKPKGSCKTYVDPCHTSDKGKGRGSPAVASGPVRNQSTSKKGSGGHSQPQKKHKVSVLYSKYKIIPNAMVPSAATISPDPPADEERPDDQTSEMDPDVCNNNNNNNDLVDEMPSLMETRPLSTETRDDKPVMFPMEMHTVVPESLVQTPAYQHNSLADRQMQKDCREKRETVKRDNTEVETRENSKHQKKIPERSEQSVASVTNKNDKKTGSGKSRRKATDVITGVPEHSVVVVSERERDTEYRDHRNETRVRSHCSNMKSDMAKGAHNSDNPVKSNGICLARSRRKCPERRPQWESGSDSSGSSSGSVRASRGSWGSWSSTSSMEGEKDINARHQCSSQTRKKDNMQYNTQYNLHTVDHDSSSCKAQSMNCLYRKDPSQSQDPTPLAPTFAPSFARVTAGVDKSVAHSEVVNSHIPEETWSSTPLTNEFRYNMTECLPFVPQGSVNGLYNGNFPWNGLNSHCNNSFPPYNDQSNFVLGGNANYQNNLMCHEAQPASYVHQPVWGEDCPQETPSSWDTAGYMSGKPYFPGTRSLSPMSGLFGSIWTPQREVPYQRHFQPDRSAPVSPLAPLCREPGGSCPPKQFNPFGPHMNLDIWNSSSNRSSNSQLSNDSGYSGDN